MSIDYQYYQQAFLDRIPSLRAAVFCDTCGTSIGSISSYSLPETGAIVIEFRCHRSTTRLCLSRYEMRYPSSDELTRRIMSFRPFPPPRPQGPPVNYIKGSKWPWPSPDNGGPVLTKITTSAGSSTAAFEWRLPSKDARRYEWNTEWNKGVIPAQLPAPKKDENTYQVPEDDSKDRVIRFEE